MKEGHLILLVRYVKGDSIPLSPSNGRDSVALTLVFRHDNDLSSDENDILFMNVCTGFEEICVRNGGRPHWAKRAACTLNEFRSMYSGEFDKFIELRRKVDADGIFLSNPYLKSIFE